MKVVTLDFETYWAVGYSLTKLNFIEYIKHPSFEVISCSIKHGSGETDVVFGHKEVGDALRAIDWSQTAAVAHNGNEFDHAILTWVYDCHPVMFFDTLALSKAKHQSEVGGSLAKLSEHYSLPAKNNAILHNTKGKRLADLDLRELAAMAAYNKGDTDNCHALFKTFRTPDTDGIEDMRDILRITAWHQNELRLCDMTARMSLYPQFEVDTTYLSTTLELVRTQKQKLLSDLARGLGVWSEEDAVIHLSSNKKFAEALQRYGVDPPRKISKTTGKETWAFSKTDQDFLDLLEHDDPMVQMLASARLGVKSTLLETRLAKMIEIGTDMDGWIPITLAYHAATTGRWGGRVWNPQNLPRINRKAPKLTDALRKSLVAPPGHKVVVSDLSGIELRVNHYLWGVASTEQLYAGDPKADLYKEFAAFLYIKTPEEVTDQERQVAKVAQLGLGFGAGATTFRRVAKLMGGVTLAEDEAERVVQAWRTKYASIVVGWQACQRAVQCMSVKAEMSVDGRGLVRVRGDRILLPSGRFLYYPELQRIVGAGSKIEYVYGRGKNHSKIYSGLLDENIVQAIARDVIALSALEIAKVTGRTPALTVHDELVYVVPEDQAEHHLATINSIMRTPPSWLPGIVLWSEGGIGDNYGEAK